MRLIFVLLLGLLTTPAFAADFSTPLLDVTGQPKTECFAVDPDSKKCVRKSVMTLGLLSALALDHPSPKMPVSQVVQSGILAEKIRAGGNVELSVDDAKLLKDAIAKLNYSTLAKAQALRLIDPKGSQASK